MTLLSLLSKIEDLENKIFYSPLYGDVRVKLSVGLNSIGLVSPINGEYLTYLTENGYHEENYSGKIMLFPSKTERDWNKYRIFLPEGTPVLVRGNEISLWRFTKYRSNMNWKHIIPIEYFNTVDWSYDKRYDYGNLEI